MSPRIKYVFVLKRKEMLRLMKKLFLSFKQLYVSTGNNANPSLFKQLAKIQQNMKKEARNIRV